VLKSKSTHNLADKETRNWSIRALTDQSTARVTFELDGVMHDENFYPWHATGDQSNGLPIAWTPSPGYHTLNVIPYNANGTPGITSELVFFVIDQPKPFNINVNFQPVDTPGLRGYKSDWGRLYNLRGNGLTYGWNKSAQPLMYDHNNPAAPDQRFDTGVRPGGRHWNIAVPNGTYSVHLMGGDISDPEGFYNIAVEGVATLVGQTNAANPWIGKTVQVAVTDNTLTISPLAGSGNHKLAFVQIVQTS
jgi:hypothetical protein